MGKKRVLISIVLVFILIIALIIVFAVREAGVPSEISCNTNQDCINYAKEQGASSEDLRDLDINCINNKCNFEFKKSVKELTGDWV